MSPEENANKWVTLFGVLSIGLPLLAYILTVLAYLGAALLFAYFAPLVRFCGVGLGTLFGIVACIHGRGRQVKLGFAGLVVNGLAFFTTVFLVVSSMTQSSR